MIDSCNNIIFFDFFIFDVNWRVICSYMIECMIVLNIGKILIYFINDIFLFFIKIGGFE